MTLEIVTFNSLVDRAWYFLLHPERLDGYRVRNGHCQACADGRPLSEEIHDPITGFTAQYTDHKGATIEHPDPMRI